MIYQFTMSIWYHVFLQFLLSLFSLIVSSVHGGRDIAHFNVGATVSSPSFAIGLETSHELTSLKKSFPVPSRSLNSMPQNEYTKDALGQNFYLPLTEVGAGNFGVTIGLGTPKRDFTLLFDTGSSTSWIRCQTCVSDCNDQPPVFDPSKSQTFLKATKCRGNDDCSFHMSYNDGSSSAGYYIFDDLSFTPNDRPLRFVFGCAQNVSGDFSGTSGVLGTIGGDISLMAQTVFNSLGLFCYCLPARDSKGFLVFGVTAYTVCPPVGPMLSLTVKPNEDGSGQYLVKLIGITIGQKRLDTSLIMGSSLNVMIDSGTIITRLSPPVYAALKSEFNNIMSGFPVAKSDGNEFDTCYNLDGVQNWTPPEMVMHFENSVDVKLDPSGVTIKESDSRVCLAFMGESDANIIGNQQLREQNVLYDLEARQLRFSAARPGCTK